MNKRIVSLLLVLTMVFSLVSCGNSNKTTDNESTDAPSLSTLFEKIDDVDAKTAEVKMDIDLSGITSETTGLPFQKLGLNFAVVSEGEDSDKASIEVGYRLDDATDYSTLTTIVCADKTVYVDYATLKTAAGELLNQFGLSMYSAYLDYLPDAGYVMIDEATLTQYLSAYGVDTSELTATDDADSKVAEDVAMEAIEYVAVTIQEATKDISPALISGSDDDIKITVTKDNLEATCDALSALDISAKYDGLVEAVKAVNGSDTYVSELTSDKDSIVSEITDGLAEAKEGLDEFKTFNVNADFAVSGDTGSRVVKESFSMDIEDATDLVSFSLEATIGEAVSGDQQITVPSDVTDFETFMNELSPIISQFSGTGVIQ